MTALGARTHWERGAVAPCVRWLRCPLLPCLAPQPRALLILRVLEELSIRWWPQLGRKPGLSRRGWEEPGSPLSDTTAWVAQRVAGTWLPGLRWRRALHRGWGRSGGLD